MGDYRVEKPTRFHSSSFRPIANLLTQRRPVTFGESVFRKTSAMTEVDPTVMQLLGPILEEVIPRNPEILKSYNVETAAELLPLLSSDPALVAQILDSYAQSTGKPQYRELAQHLYQDWATEGKAGRATRAVTPVADVAATAGDFIPHAGLRTAAQLAPFVPLGQEGTSLINPNNVGSDATTQNLVGQIQTEEKLTKAKAVAGSPHVAPNVKAEAQAEAQQLEEQLQGLRRNYQLPDPSALSSPSTLSSAGTAAGTAAGVIDRATNAMVAPGVSYLMPFISGAARQAGIQQQELDTPQYAANTSANILHTGGDVAKAIAARGAAKRLIGQGLTAGGMARALPAVSRAGAMNPVGLALQGAASLAEGAPILTDADHPERAAIDEERIRQQAMLLRGKTSPLGHLVKNVIGGFARGVADPTSAGRRGFRAAVNNAVYGVDDFDKERINTYLQEADTVDSQNRWREYLLREAPWLSNTQLTSMAQEAAAREIGHRYSQSSDPMVATVQLQGDDGVQEIDSYDLDQALAASQVPTGQRVNVRNLFQIAPQATMSSIQNPEDDFFARVPQEQTNIRPLFIDGRGQPIKQQAYTQATTDRLQEQTRAQEAQKTQEAAARQQAQQKDIARLQHREQQKARTREQEDVLRRTSREVEHQAALERLRQPQVANAKWRQEADKQWGFTAATPAPAVAEKPAVKPPVSPTPTEMTPPSPPVPPVVPPQVKVGGLGSRISGWR